MLAGATRFHIGQVEPGHELLRLGAAAPPLTSRGSRLRREI